MELLQALLKEELSRKELLVYQQHLVDFGFDTKLKPGAIEISAVYNGKQYSTLMRYEREPDDLIEEACVWLLSMIDYPDKRMEPATWLEDDDAQVIVSYMLDPHKEVMFKAAQPSDVKLCKRVFQADGWKLLGDSGDPFEAGVELVFGRQK